MNNTDVLLKQSPLFRQHLALKAKMVAFAGWNMPVQYSGLLDEHKTVRESVGIFDVSHMGEINITGRGSFEFLQKMTINDLSKLEIGDAQYNAICTENGTVIDDIIIYKRGFDNYFICVNASNLQKDFSWFRDHCPKQGVILENLSDDYAQIAIQGPKSRELLSKIVDINILQLAYYKFAEGKVLGIPSLIARTGYTGELGYELYIPASIAPKIWNGLMDVGQEFGIKPCGLGARDTLRLEPGYLLYGNDMDENITALECGLSWITKFDKPTFIGKDALMQQKKQGLSKKLIGFEMQDKAIGRHGYKIYTHDTEGQNIGLVTSGSPSPSLSKNIGLAYVTTEFSKIGSQFWVEIRNERKPAIVCKKPFYIKGSANL